MKSAGIIELFLLIDVKNDVSFPPIFVCISETKYEEDAHPVLALTKFIK
jgi:hypothetical protein